MRTDVTGKPLHIPQRCACCGQPPSTEMSTVPGYKGADRVARSHAAAWRFPICTTCQHHVVRWQSTVALARWVLAGGGVLVLLFTIAGGGGGVLFIGGALVFGLSAAARYLRRREARAQCHEGCAWAGPPVFHLGEHQDVESFNFVQQSYAVDFMRANLTKLVNLSSEARALIQPDLDRLAAAEAEKKALERERVRIAAEVAHDNEAYEKCMARMDAAKGPAGRKGALEAGLRSLRQGHMRDRLMLQASRVEVAAALEKAEGLKSKTAKLRTLSEALEALRDDAVPDHLQSDLIRSLEAAIAKIEDEKNSIDLA
jgi:hypothetical protein